MAKSVSAESRLMEEMLPERVTPQGIGKTRDTWGKYVFPVRFRSSPEVPATPQVRPVTGAQPEAAGLEIETVQESGIPAAVPPMA